MKFRNKETGTVLEPKMADVAAQYAKNPRFEPVAAAPATGGTGDAPPANDLDGMDVAALLDLAAAEGVAGVKANMKAETITKAIRAHREAVAENAG